MISILAATVLSVVGGTGDVPHFERERIGDTTYEACGVFDVNNDGQLDIVSGEYWYAGPAFTDRYKITTIMRVEDYYDDFANYPIDINGDGYLDVISGGWWGQTLVWRENPKGNDTEWTNHDIATVGNVERPNFWDLDGDGFVEIVPNTPGKPQQIFKVLRDENGKAKGEFLRRSITNDPSGHGLGAGDINGDGRLDLVQATGWYEQPEKLFEDEWAWHPVFELGWSSSTPILVYDVNGDGINDVIVGMGHDYGLWWFEQGKGDDGAPTWTKHIIDEERSQYHEMQLADVDNDGEPELVTGKRWRAHLGNDPGASDPLGLYYFNIDGGKFERITLNYGDAAVTSGSGIYMTIIDIDNNGWLDIVAPGKEGLYLFRNMGK